MSESDRANTSPDEFGVRETHLGAAERLAHRRARAEASRRLIRILLLSSVMNWVDLLDPH